MTDARVTGILIAHLGAFGSGELKTSPSPLRPCTKVSSNYTMKLEDLKVLRRSPDLFNNVKIGQGYTAYNKTYFVLPYMGIAAILVK